MNLRRKNLHIIRDDKFIDAAYRVFEEVRPNENEFIVLGRRKELVYIKNAKVSFCRPSIIWWLRKIFHLRYKSLIIHGLSNEFLKLLVLSISERIPIFWIGWGHDYYGLSTTNLYKEKTQTIVNKYKLNEFKRIKSNFIKELEHDVDMKAVLERIDFFGPVLCTEFQFVKDFHPLSRVEYLDWNYLTLEEDIIKGFENKVVSGNNLMLGNSSNPINNQVDALDDALDFSFSFDNIICPLSYGSGEYRNHVIRKGELFFLNRFKPITSFMAYSDYVERIISCRYVFINSCRQAAMGNILLMLYLGAYVILDTINPAYAFFKENGIQIFSIDEAKRGGFPQLNIHHTRTKLIELWGQNSIKEKTKTVFARLSIPTFK